MILKDGVKLNGVKPEILLGIYIANGVWKELGDELVITSVTDSKHGRGSFHYIGMAVDFRTRNFSDNGLEAVNLLRKKLTNEFDVVHEKTHIHLEFNPK